MNISDEQASAMRKAWEDAGACTMEDAMRAAAAVLPELQPVPMPDRVELAKAMHAAYARSTGPGVSSWEALNERAKTAVLAEADVAIARCSRVAVPAEVFALVHMWRNAESLGGKPPSERDAGEVAWWRRLKGCADELEAALIRARQPRPGAAVAWTPELASEVLSDMRERCTADAQALYEAGLEVFGADAPRVAVPGAAVRALPTRDEIAREMCRLYVTTAASSATRWEHIWSADIKAGYRAQADYVLDLLKQHAAPTTDPVKPRACTPEQAERIRVALGKAPSLEAAINEVLGLEHAAQPDTAEVERLRAELEACKQERDEALDMSSADEDADAENEQLRTELERERANHASNVEAMRRVTVWLREQHEALRAGVMELLDRVVIGRFPSAGFAEPEWYESKGMSCTGKAVRELRGLLKPATPEPAEGDDGRWTAPKISDEAKAAAQRCLDACEGRSNDSKSSNSSPWQHTSSDGDSHTFRNSVTGEGRTLEGFPTADDARWALDEPSVTEAAAACVAEMREVRAGVDELPRSRDLHTDVTKLSKTVGRIEAEQQKLNDAFVWLVQDMATHGALTADLQETAREAWFYAAGRSEALDARKGGA